jgi:DNA-binding HxlR family transcriptional regulator
MPESLKVLRVLTNKGVLDCLAKISSTESRFTDLADVCPSERLRSLRLAELEAYGLIQREPRKDGRKYRIVYRITGKGRRMLKMLDSFRGRE